MSIFSPETTKKILKVKKVYKNIDLLIDFILDKIIELNFSIKDIFIVGGMVKDIIAAIKLKEGNGHD